MLNIYFLINTFGAAALFILASIVLLRNSKTEVNKSFSMFTVAVALWILSNYFSNVKSISHEAVLIANHATLFFSYLSLTILNYFLLSITNNRLTKYKVLLTAASAFLGLLALTPLVVQNVKFEGEVSAITFGPLSPVYFASFAVSAVAIFYTLIHGIRYEKGVEKQRIKVIFNGALVTIGISIVTNAVFPVAIGFYGLTNIGPVSTLALIYALFYTITKHKMFDIRFIVARSLAYILLVSTLTALYFGLFLGMTVYLIPGSAKFLQQIVPLLTALLIAASYPLFKRRFDKLTNQFFYRDMYDPQTFLDELNQTVIDNIELGILLRHTAKVIEENLKCEYCMFSIFGEENTEPRFIGTSGSGQYGKGMQFIRDELQQLGKKVLVADDLGEEFESLRDTLSKNNIAIVVQLQSSTDPNQKARSYITMGPKKSGNMYSKQDIRIISIIADELVIAIQNALRFEEIQQFNATLQSRINDATAKLEKTNKKLQDMDETKDEFISMASHQLRTPLTSVKGYISMVLEGDAGKINSDQRKMLSQAFISSQRMTYLISDLLNVSRLKTGKFVIEKVPVNLADVIEQEAQQLEETAKTRNLKLIYEKPKDFPAIELDETKTRQVIMNFLDNAIYYTASGGEIEVILSDKLKSIDFIVKDNGIGVPKAMQPHLFTKFYRADNAKRARPDGTGLGLFMAKKVVVAQGGAILFHSEEGKGSTFGFSFPKEEVKTK